MKTKTLICVLGPTAIGKTALGIKIAQQLNTEIISADSRQLYKEISIGTAKPSEAELAAVKHHFINSHSITDIVNVGLYEKQALQIIENLLKKNHTVVMVGGSGLYIKAVLEGFDELPTVTPTIRNQLNHELQQSGIAKLQHELQQHDPNYFHKIDTQNPQRIIRALEVIRSTGNTFSSYQSNKKNERSFKILKIGLNTTREKLYQRINERVDVMMQNGLLAEVKSAQAYKHLNALQTVGYCELFDYLDGKTSLKTAVELIKQNTRRFAKRQLTWFRRDDNIHWCDIENENQIIKFVLNNFII
ncbi:MAG: tRNA (adenosine(37)-N6)-dimethylallyltransferase MiaA [Sphingobacteriales bacterium]|nr:MAG: tRNA (adenosine(37)-N6)-dimethylallyltransferase MiaA [Sphingobacteriales bacterium]TAF83668.1 MAG: tRNA (adenosine(37)-N6)-dimethylallyltransferase MiaA [Sphingobacteriales bacterium]